MIALLPVLLLASCTDKGKDTGPNPCCEAEDDDDGGSGFDSGTPGTDAWQLVAMDTPTDALRDVDEVRRVVRTRGSDGLWLIDGDGAELRYVSPAYVQPTGERFCVEGGGTPEDCSGVLLTAGEISTTPSPTTCVDDTADVLWLVKEGGGRVEIAGTARGGESWNQYNRVYATRSIAGKDVGKVDVACAARDGRLLVAGDSTLARVEEEGNRLAFVASMSIPSGPRRLAWLGAGDTALVHGKDGNAWLVDAEAMVVGPSLATSGDAVASAVDPDRGVVWIAHGDDLRLRRYDADGAATASVELCGEPTDMAVDARSGAVHVLVECGGDWGLQLIDASGVRGQVVLDETPLALVPPGGMGHAGAIVRDADGNAALRIWLVDDPADERPPLTVWITSTLEEPFTNSGMACTNEENPSTNFEDLLTQLRENIPLLQATGLPVAMGVTWEFASKAEECGEIGILEEMADAGFTLGTMVHDKPCYACTDGDVPGETPPSCSRADADYAPPDDADACWPSDENFCPRGDDSCWADWVGDKAMAVDEWIPGGSRFIFGADRHVLWDWEYIGHGYRRFPRADGSTGYEMTFFGGNWIYPEVDNANEPRAKDPAPWDPERMGSAWYTAEVEAWDQDSVFSELAYMPGNSVSLSRLQELHESDLTVVHLLAETNSGIGEGDFLVLDGLLAQAAAHRSDAPGTFYWHLPEFTKYAFVPEDDTRFDYVDAFDTWKTRTETVYGDAGLGVMEWGSPVEAREKLREWGGR